MGSLLERISVVAVIVAAAAVVWGVLDSRSGQSEAGPPVERLAGEIVSSPPTAGQRGDPGARVALVEFSDLECPFCARHAQEVYPRLIEDFVDDGRVLYILRHYPLERIHPLAFQAATAVECAGDQGDYWGMHDRLFAAAEDLSRPGLLEAAASLDLDTAAFEACIDGDAVTTRVLADMEYAEGLSVSTTPTFLFAEVQADGSLALRARMEGAGPYEAFASTLDELLAETTLRD